MQRVINDDCFNDINKLNPDIIPFDNKPLLSDIINLRSPKWCYNLSKTFYTYHDKMGNYFIRNKKYEKSNGFGHLIITLNNLAYCLNKTQGYKMNVLFNNDIYRYFDLIELGRLQGFDDNIKWVNSDFMSSCLLGNSVCIPAVKYVASKLLND